MIQVGDKVWVNDKGPCCLWARSDLVVKALTDNGEVTLGLKREVHKSVRRAFFLKIEQIDKQ